MKRLVVFAAFLLVLPVTQAREFVVNAADIPPFCHEEGSTQSGIAVDMLRAVSKATGITFSIRFLPWKRAQIETQSGADQLIIPLTRTPEREKAYQWIGPVVSYNFVVVTVGDRPAPRTLEEARALSVGVLRGNPMEALLPRLGFTNVKPGYTEDAIARLLQSKRIDAWVVADIVAKDVYRRIGGNPAELRVGVRLGDTMSIQLAASPQFPHADRKAIADELNRLWSSGEAEKIINRYRMGATP